MAPKCSVLKKVILFFLMTLSLCQSPPSGDNATFIKKVTLKRTVYWYDFLLHDVFNVFNIEHTGAPDVTRSSLLDINTIWCNTTSEKMWQIASLSFLSKPFCRSAFEPHFNLHCGSQQVLCFCFFYLVFCNKCSLLFPTSAKLRPDLL